MFYYTYCIEFLCGHYKGKKYYGRRKSKCPPEQDVKYIGSGVIPGVYFGKYGASPDTYIKTILNTYNSMDELIQAEQKLLDEHVGKEYCVNFNTCSTGGGCNKNRICVTNDIESCYIYADKLEEYLGNGFRLGRHDHYEPWNKDKTGIYTEEQLQHMSDGVKDLWNDPEYRTNVTESLKGNKNARGHHLSELSKLTISLKNKDKTSPFKGKHHTEESKKKNSESVKQYYENGGHSWLYNSHLPEKCKEHLSDVMTDTKLMNNGKTHKFVKIVQVDEYIANGWKLGHIIEVTRKDKRNAWLTNGQIEMRVKKQDIEKYINEGFYVGRLKRK